MQSVVREVFILDSSEPQKFEEMKGSLDPKWCVKRVLPLGNSEFARPYAASLVSSGMILEVDADEIVTPQLMKKLTSLSNHDAFILPRFEKQLNAYTHHLRLYDPRKIRFGGPSYGFPRVDGTVGILERKFCLIHKADFSNYLSGRKRDSYLLWESYERPFTRQYLVAALSLSFGSFTLSFPCLHTMMGEKSGDVALSNAGIHAAIYLEFLKNMIQCRSLLWSKFQFRYTQEKLKYLLQLPAEVYQKRMEISSEIRKSGGLIRYLGLDEPSRISCLSADFDWKTSAAEVLELMISYRHRNGIPANSYTSLKSQGV